MIAGPDDAGRRLDKVLRVVLKDRALSQIYAALRKGGIRVNGLRAEPELRLAEGDRISLPLSLGLEPAEGCTPPESEDWTQIADILVLATKNLIFINKPRGELSQGQGGLEEKISHVLASRRAASLSFVPGPLHRLDRNTTGLLTFPRSAEGARAFTSLLRSRRLVKSYLALVEGLATQPAEWRDRIERNSSTMTSFLSAAGDEAHAEMRPLLAKAGRSLILVELHSGLTHQIRVQAASRGLVLTGDSKYGGPLFAGGYILHAFSLAFPEPPFPDLPMRVTAPLPKSARLRLSGLFGQEALDSALEAALKG